MPVSPTDYLPFGLNYRHGCSTGCRPKRTTIRRQLFCVHFIVGVIIVVTALQTCVHVVDRPIVGSF